MRENEVEWCTRYFENSQPGRRHCPFGKECFYKHENDDGTPYVFHRGADYYMQVGGMKSESSAFLSYDDSNVMLGGTAMISLSATGIIALRTVCKSY